MADILWQYAPQILAMAALVAGSALFSCGEAALFYLGREDRRAMLAGGAGQRLALDLLTRPERLLSAILFWNLSINIAYFALASTIGTRLDRAGRTGEAGVFSIASLMVIILLSEMLPKNVAVLKPRSIAGLLSFPVAIAVRLLDPLMPALRLVNKVSQRLFVPDFQPEPYLELGDLERAITISTQDAALAHQEQAVLQNIVALSEMRVDEVMRPRLRFESFRPPVQLADLNGKLTPSGYVLVTETQSEEVAAAIPLKHLHDIPSHHLEHHAEKVLYIPWCSSVATAAEELRRQNRSVAAVINEFGETIGIVTVDDILETVVLHHLGRSERMLDTASFTPLGEGAWQVTGMTTLRRIARRLDCRLPATRSVTLGGVLQEQLQRLPREADVVDWGGFRITVLHAPERGLLTASLEWLEQLSQSDAAGEERTEGDR